MLFFCLLFIIAGMSLLATAGIMITYTLMSGERITMWRSPNTWPAPVKRWARIGAIGLGSTLLGMVLTMLAT